MKYPVAEQMLKEGKVKEQLFAALVGGTMLAPLEDLMGKDIELSLSFDVKGQKKLFRRDAEASRVYHWVELKKGNGFKGWLFQGALFLAFETEQSWLVVLKERLADHIRARMDYKSRVTEPEPYKMYYRKNLNLGGEDILTLIEVAELRKLATCELVKEAVA